MISADSTVVNHYVYNMNKYKILHKIKTVSRINTVEGAFSYESDISYMRNTDPKPIKQLHSTEKKNNKILLQSFFFTRTKVTGSNTPSLV